MGSETKIAWTEHTFNPWIGCTKISPGCDHCYAESLNHRWGNDNWGKGKPRRITSDANWLEPLKWNKVAQQEHRQHLVFCASLADVFDDEAPEGARERLWDLIDMTPHLTWQLLTKRPQRLTRYLPQRGFKFNNIWLGSSAENQQFYDLRWPWLRLAAIDLDAVSFISYEPALGPLLIDPFARRLEERRETRRDLIDLIDPPPRRFVPDWIIFGGESGHGRRPMEIMWAEELMRECEMWEVKFFMKQVSASTPVKGAHLIPAHLLIREFPAGLGVPDETTKSNPLGE